jgi:hypothetical protein
VVAVSCIRRTLSLLNSDLEQIAVLLPCSDTCNELYRSFQDPPECSHRVPGLSPPECSSALQRLIGNPWYAITVCSLKLTSGHYCFGLQPQRLVTLARVYVMLVVCISYVDVCQKRQHQDDLQRLVIAKVVSALIGSSTICCASRAVYH